MPTWMILTKPDIVLHVPFQFSNVDNYTLFKKCEDQVFGSHGIIIIQFL